MEFKPLYREDQLKIINPKGSAGVITLWSEPEKQWKKLQSVYPKLFEKDSSLVTLTSFYGDGLPQMLANLAYNPQINKIAMIGNEIKGAASSELLFNFLNKGIHQEKIGNVEISKINGTSFYLDSQLKPEMYSHLQVERFKSNELEKLVSFISQQKSRDLSEKDRIKIKLIEPEFKDFPSDITNHNIVANSPTEAWAEVMYRIDRYGVNVQIPKKDGSETRRALFNLRVNIKDASFEANEQLRKFNLEPKKLKAYQEEILNGKLPEGNTYSYGNRGVEYWGGDAWEKCGELLRKEPNHRHGFVSLWDTNKDLLQRKSSPCWVDAYFIRHPIDNNLMMTAEFRTHNAASAWIKNAYGLRAVQEYVAKEAGINPGQLTVISRWIGINPDSSMANLEIIKNNRKSRLDIHDPKGYYNITADPKSGEIIANHYSPEGLMLEEFRGKSAIGIKNKLRKTESFSTADHALWVGMKLMEAEYELKKK